MIIIVLPSPLASVNEVYSLIRSDNTLCDQSMISICNIKKMFGGGQPLSWGDFKTNAPFDI